MSLLKQTASHYRRQSRHYAKCIELLKFVDIKIYSLGREIITIDAALAVWLSTPKRALNGKAPLMVMKTSAGRMKVSEILTAIVHGILT